MSAPDGLPDAAEFTIREATPADEQPIGEVAYQTGFFGESAARYFPDQRLFADLWVRPYFAGAGRVAFVAERRGQVEGYILGAPDQAVYTRAVLGVVFGVVLPGLLTGRYRRPWPALPYFVRGQLLSSPHGDWNVFPAHLHLNLLAEARGFGLSRPLLERYLERLNALGVRGVQLSTTLENQVALKVYAKQGFILIASRRSAFWKPWLGHGTVHLVLAKPLASPER
ncbi:GNAT family N-acetyltransferase [Deinococcus sp.]|uniref:GNAT family N-acetyltransferase n=1 Tax=Deinococcus sp. TaxID=47478 RepID=UPI0025C12138|nr:GNAT family N-acetyltransferase [Deinococcus sp.]